MTLDFACNIEHFGKYIILTSIHFRYFYSLILKISSLGCRQWNKKLTAEAHVPAPKSPVKLGRRDPNTVTKAREQVLFCGQGEGEGAATCHLCLLRGFPFEDWLLGGKKKVFLDSVMKSYVNFSYFRKTKLQPIEYAD